MKTSCPAVLLASCVAIACAACSASHPAGSASGASGPVGDGAAYANLVVDDGPLSDGRAAAVLLAATDAIGREGYVGAERGHLGDLQAFAEQSVTDATSATDAGSTLLARDGIAVEECATSTALLNADVQTLAMLQSASEADFDGAFVTVRIDATTKLLALLDRAILPGASNADLRAWAQALRGTAASELAGLQVLRGELTHSR